VAAVTVAAVSRKVRRFIIGFLRTRVGIRTIIRSDRR
jgi:hypothetical protein